MSLKSKSEAPQHGALTTTARHEDATFIAAVERGSLSTTQFHPEKSGAAGVQLLRNCCATG